MDSGGLSLWKWIATGINAYIDLMNIMGEYQTKESPGRIIWKHYATMNFEKHDSSREEGMSSLPEGEWAVAESQRWMTQDKVKLVCWGANPEKRVSFWEEGLSFLREGVWAVAESQRGMAQRMRRMTTRQTKETEKESVNINFHSM